MTYPSLLRRALPCALVLASFAFPGSAGAQTFPDQPLHILVGASPGGGTDILARTLADKFTTGLKQTVVVENRPGASNTIAAGMAARRSEEHTSELQSLMRISYAVFCLKKKNK